MCKYVSIIQQIHAQPALKSSTQQETGDNLKVLPTLIHLGCIGHHLMLHDQGQSCLSKPVMSDIDNDREQQIFTHPVYMYAEMWLVPIPPK